MQAGESFEGFSSFEVSGSSGGYSYLLLHGECRISEMFPPPQ